MVQLVKPIESMNPDIIKKPLLHDPSLSEALETFFANNTPESSWNFFFKIIQCWTLKDCKIKAQLSDEEVALFFDQLIDLVAAAYILHQANRVPNDPMKGNDHA